MSRRIWSSAFLLAALVILSLPHLNVTGNVIAEIPQGQNIIYVISLAFFLVSVFLFLSKQSLDAIVIPSGGGTFDPKTGMYSEDRERVETGLAKGGQLKKEGYYIVSGYKREGIKDMREGQSYSIYNFLRNHGIKPSRMIIEGKSHDTLENVLYTLKKLKEREEKRGIERPWDIAFVSYPDHLKRFRDFYEKAIKKGLIKKDDFKLHEIKTSENAEEKAYENSPVRKFMHWYKKATINRYKAGGGGVKYNEKPDPAISFIRKIGSFIKRK